MNRLAMCAAFVAFASIVTAVEFPNPSAFNPSWESANPGKTYSKDLPTAALRGNAEAWVSTLQNLRL